MNVITLTNALILDCTGALPYIGTVIVNGNKIASVIPGDKHIANEGLIIDCHGATLMPGLIEPHAHISLADTIEDHELGNIPIEEHTLITMYNALKMLDQGFTTCISAGSSKPRLDIVIRNAINKGEIPGPRLFANSPELTVTGGSGDIRSKNGQSEAFAIICDGEHEFRKISRDMIREGVDLLKIAISGDGSIASAGSDQITMLDSEVAAVTEIARMHGIKVAAHCRSAESIKMAIRHGIDLIYHATLCNDEVIKLLTQYRDHVFIMPTLGLLHSIVHNVGKYGINAEMIQHSSLDYELDMAIQNMQVLHRNGVRVLPGGDYGFACNPMGENAKDIMHFVNLLRFTPMEAILAATKFSAEILLKTHKLGQIREGYLADILVVDGNPLDDITILQNKNNLLVIMKDGKLHKPTMSTDAISEKIKINYYNNS